MHYFGYPRGMKAYHSFHSRLVPVTLLRTMNSSAGSLELKTRLALQDDVFKAQSLFLFIHRFPYLRAELLALCC